MPPSTLQARIKAFEALGSGASKEVLDGIAIHTEPEHLLDRPHSPSAASIPPIVPTAYSPSASPNSLRNRTSLLDLKDWVIDDGPLGSPTTAILSGYSPLQVATPLPHESAPLISFEGSPPKLVRAPPLPPRKLSFNSPRSVSAPAASPTATTTSQSNNNMLMPPATDPVTLADLSPSDGIRRVQGHMHASSVSSFHSVSLSSEGDDSTTPGALHAFPMEREWTGTGTEDGESLDESFENVSAPSCFLPSTTFTPRQPPLSSGKPALVTKQPPPPPPSSQPPKLPQRPVHYPRSSANSFASHSTSPSPVTSSVSSPVTRTPSASSSSLSLQSTRRVPPPPPPSAAAAIPTTNAPRPRSHPPSARTSVQSTGTTTSDRSSLLSQGTATSRTSISSRASVSASASTPTSATGAKQQAQATRARYDALFTANVRAHAPKPPPPPTPTPAKRQNAGWRGLSIDVPPPPSPIPSPTPPSSALTEKELGPDARLDGRLVREIWLKSRLQPQRLRGIWSECDPDGTGSLDRDAFVRGMLRIDDELRRAQVLGRARAGSSASARAPRPVPSRPILR
ncbi:hypothetical protein DFH94DRAFT_770895 [Russula ochroleuca]|uniref:EF-hand domain-containing protein n=1 Tax=Russula ochroleuca TaxID=152965 RepID=A0A9P5MR05_9AGAM|nr:hypothetical protein DFH94DRAFT_770895 [Russula ochroleuca]